MNADSEGSQFSNLVLGHHRQVCPKSGGLGLSQGTVHAQVLQEKVAVREWRELPFSSWKVAFSNRMV